MSGEGDGPLIAIVDDDEAIRDAVDSIVKSAGYRSAVFESGIAFLDSRDKHEIDCLVLDIDMPRLNGLEVQRRLAEMGYLIPPTIFLTGNMSKLSERAVKQGAVAVLRKTCSDEDLLGALSFALQPRQI
jgi:two-component system, LuxR family, response regulator FixJ